MCVYFECNCMKKTRTRQRKETVAKDLPFGDCNQTGLDQTNNPCCLIEGTIPFGDLQKFRRYLSETEHHNKSKNIYSNENKLKKPRKKKRSIS